MCEYENTLYMQLKELIDKRYYPKHKDEILIHRSIMLRKRNIETLQKINSGTETAVSRLINLSIKEVWDKE